MLTSHTSGTSVDLALLMLRASFGLMLVAHGLNHWRGGGRIAGTARWFESIGLRNGVLQAWMSVVTEIGAGTGLALGLLTPLCCAAGVSVMSVAIFTVHRHNGFFIIKEGWEYTSLIAVSLIVVATLGPGAWSVDHAGDLPSLIGHQFNGWTGFLVAVVLGLGGAAALLIATWRRPATGD